MVLHHDVIEYRPRIGPAVAGVPRTRKLSAVIGVNTSCAPSSHACRRLRRSRRRRARTERLRFLRSLGSDSRCAPLGSRGRCALAAHGQPLRSSRRQPASIGCVETVACRRRPPHRRRPAPDSRPFGEPADFIHRPADGARRRPARDVGRDVRGHRAEADVLRRPILRRDRCAPRGSRRRDSAPARRPRGRQRPGRGPRRSSASRSPARHRSSRRARARPAPPACSRRPHRAAGRARESASRSISACR